MEQNCNHTIQHSMLVIKQIGLLLLLYFCSFWKWLQLIITQIVTLHRAGPVTVTKILTMWLAKCQTNVLSQSECQNKVQCKVPIMFIALCSFRHNLMATCFSNFSISIFKLSHFMSVTHYLLFDKIKPKKVLKLLKNTSYYTPYWHSHLL